MVASETIAGSARKAKRNPSPVLRRRPSGISRTASICWPIAARRRPTRSANPEAVISRAKAPPLNTYNRQRNRFAVDFTELASYRPKLERLLRSDYTAAQRSAGPVFAPYLHDLSEFTLRGGKRFRALLVLAGYHLATGRPPDVVLPAAAALEHFQSWMLVHDDIIDHSEQRRGGPTLHRALAQRHGTTQLLGDADAYGVGMGITLGDLQEPFTIASLLSVDVPLARRQAAL